MIASALPLVTEDFGLRPVGQPDECFYCHQKLGTSHTWKCALLDRQATYEVWHITDCRKRVGTWITKDPISWDNQMRYFHKNESSWCADNLRSQDHLILSEDFSLHAEDETTCICGMIELIPICWGE